jgi:hypothetical protein
MRQNGRGSCVAARPLATGPASLFFWVRLVSSEGGSGPECVIALRGAGVEPLVLAGEVVAPVFVEVAVADHCAQGEDGLGALKVPSCSGDVEPVAVRWRQAPSSEWSRPHPAGATGRYHRQHRHLRHHQSR